MKTQIEFQDFNLKNGVKIIFVKRPEIYTAYLSGYVRAGSVYETRQTSGSSHFIEHLLFRGCKKLENAAEIDKEKELLGLSHSAYTDYDRVNYHATFPPTEIESVLRFCNSLLFESLLKDSEVEKERQVVLEEEKLRKDNLQIQTWDLALKTRLQNKNHPLTLPREGLPETIAKLSRGTLANFYKIHFNPASLLLVIGGDFKLKKLKKSSKREFSYNKILAKVTPKKFSLTDFSKFAVACQTKSVEKTYVYFTFPAFSYNRPLTKRVGLTLLNQILQKIRLDQRLYQEKGLSYDWNVFWAVPAPPIGIFGFYSSCEPKNLKEIIAVFFEELEKLKEKPFDFEEIERQRNYLNKIQAMEFDSLAGAVNWFLDDFFYYQRFYSPDEVIFARNKVTPKLLFQIANEVVNFDKLNVTILGPTTQSEAERLVKKHLK